MSSIEPSSSTPPPLPAARTRPLILAAQLGIVATALVVFAAYVVVGTRHSEKVEAFKSDSTDPLKKGIAEIARESVAPLSETKNRDGEQVSIVEQTIRKDQAKAAEAARTDELKAQQAKLAEQTKRAKAIASAEAKRVAIAKEKEFAAWKAKRKAAIQETANKLRPEQVQSWNRMIASWNKLTPAQRESLWRQEYQQLETAPKGGADLSKSSISDADWERAQTHYTASAAPTIPRLGVVASAAPAAALPAPATTGKTAAQTWMDEQVAAQHAAEWDAAASRAHEWEMRTGVSLEAAAERQSRQAAAQQQWAAEEMAKLNQQEANRKEVEAKIEAERPAREAAAQAYFDRGEAAWAAMQAQNAAAAQRAELQRIADELARLRR